MSINPTLKGTSTEKNLAKAYALESTAYTRYIFFAKSARKEGYHFFSEIFEETAANEMEHAKTFLSYLQEGAVIAGPLEIDPGILTPTVDNLKVAEHEEDLEGFKLYTGAAQTAKDEGFAEISVRFRIIAGIEARHKARFEKMRELIETDSVWKREEPIEWQCMVCGYVFEGKEPPRKCPGCGNDFQYFKPGCDLV